MNIQDDTPEVDVFSLSLDSSRLKELFDEYYDRLVYFSKQMVRDQSIAEDIAQESFIKYWSQYKEVSEDKYAIKNYLYRTVRNLSLNHIRHSKVVNQYIEKHGGVEPEEQPFIYSLITAEVISEIHNAIKSLPESYQLVCSLGFLEGKKNQEIADQLCMSINTVKKQKQRALQLLKLKLSADLFCIILLLASRH